MLEELNKIKDLKFVTDKKTFYSAVFLNEDLIRIFNELKNNAYLNFTS